MRLFTITFTDGTSSQEYGKDEADVRTFLANSYAHKSVESIKEV